MFHKLFPAFRYKNYRIFFSAQIISLIGTWMQTVAQGYLAFQLTHSAFWVGVVASVNYLPTTFFALLGGTIVDKYPKKNILQLTQFSQFILASTLGLLVINGHVSLPVLMVLTFLMGLVSAVDQPARFTLPNELVEKEHLHSAIAMNMSMFNSARIVGPAVAGWLIYAFGIGWAFLLNGISFLAPFISFSFMTWAPHIRRPGISTITAIKEGLSYASHHNLIKYLLIYLGMVSIFGWSYVTILPVMADQVFHQNARGLGYMYSAAGAGSVLAAVIMSAAASKFDPKKLIFFGGLLYGLSLILFSLSPTYLLALVLLFVTGFGITTQNSTIQARIQHSVEDKFRGRVSSIQSMMLMGMHPVGSFQVGTVAEHFGSQLAVRVGGIMLFLSSIALYLKTPKKY